MSSLLRLGIRAVAGILVATDYSTITLIEMIEWA